MSFHMSCRWHRSCWSKFIAISLRPVWLWLIMHFNDRKAKFWLVAPFYESSSPILKNASIYNKTSLCDHLRFKKTSAWGPLPNSIKTAFTTLTSLRNKTTSQLRPVLSNPVEGGWSYSEWPLYRVSNPIAVLKDQCWERGYLSLDGPHLLGNRSYISMKLTLSPKTTCFERPYFYGWWPDVFQDRLHVCCNYMAPKSETIFWNFTSLVTWFKLYFAGFSSLSYFQVRSCFGLRQMPPAWSFLHRDLADSLDIWSCSLEEGMCTGSYWYMRWIWELSTHAHHR